MRKTSPNKNSPGGKRATRSAGGIVSVRAMFLEKLVGFATAPVRGLLAGFFLLFGGMFLGIAWLAGPQSLIDSYHYRPFTARTTGHIVESWMALEFNPRELPKGELNWQPYGKIQPCAIVEYAGDSGEIRRAFCGNRFQFSDDVRLDDWHTMAPGVPFDFQRDGSGFAVSEFRLSKVAFEWLSAHPPYDTFLLSKPPPTTALAALREQFDRPLDIALASWTTRVVDFPLAYDPHHPDLALPARIVEERREFGWSGLILAVLTLILAVPGLFVWRLGMAVLTNQSGALLWLLTLGPLLALPWWSAFLPQVVRYANNNWAEVVSDMLDDVQRITRFTASAPEGALLAAGERLQWTADSGIYADTFGRIRFAQPQPLPASRDAAMIALREQASTQVSQWSSPEQAALFIRLRQQYEANAQQVQSLFFTAAEDTLRDANADAAAHRAARNFLIFASSGKYYDNQLDQIEVQPRSQ